MQKFRRQLASIYSEDEARLLSPWQRMRQRFLAPVALLLSRLGIGPNLLSFFSVALGAGFCLFAPFHFALAFWLLVASLVCDGLDGVEARLRGSTTARGAFTDLFCDQAVVALSVVGMVWRKAIDPVLAAFFVYVYTAITMFLLLHHLLQVSSRWIIRPSRMLFYVAIALNFFFHINWLNQLLMVYLLALPLLALSFWRLRRAL